MDWAFDIKSRNLRLDLDPEDSPIFFCTSFYHSMIYIKSGIHFELIFVYSVNLG